MYKQRLGTGVCLWDSVEAPPLCLAVNCECHHDLCTLLVKAGACPLAGIEQCLARPALSLEGQRSRWHVSSWRPDWQEGRQTGSEVASFSYHAPRPAEVMVDLCVGSWQRVNWSIAPLGSPVKGFRKDRQKLSSRGLGFLSPVFCPMTSMLSHRTENLGYGGLGEGFALTNAQLCSCFLTGFLQVGAHSWVWRTTVFCTSFSWRLCLDVNRLYCEARFMLISISIKMFAPAGTRSDGVFLSGLAC